MELITTALPFFGVMSSEIGGRKENQDTCGFTDTPFGLLLVVCDGMGGGPAGKTASVIATSSILEYVKTGGKPIRNNENTPLGIIDGDIKTETHNEEISEASNTEHSEPISGRTKPINDKRLLKTAVKWANEEMLRQIELNPALSGMGTTVAAVLINEKHAVIAHVGDSRIYQIRGKQMVFRTSDHSRVGEMVQAGTLTEEQARLSAYSNVITRALGIGPEVKVDIDERPFEKGDRFVICSDGIWGAKSQKEMIKLFSGNPRSLEGTLDVLNITVENAGREKGGHHDNYTAIILETKTDSILKEQMSKKTRLLFRALAIFCGASVILNIVLLCLPKGEKKIVMEPVQEKEMIDSLKKEMENSANTLKEYSAIIESLKQRAQVDSEQIEALTKALHNESSNSVKPPKQETTNVSQENNEISPKEQLNAIIEEIEVIGKMNQGGEKNKKINNVVTQLENIKKNFSEENRKYINKAIKHLKEDQTKKPPKDSEGQCNQIIKILKNIK